MNQSHNHDQDSLMQSFMAGQNFKEVKTKYEDFINAQEEIKSLKMKNKQDLAKY